MSLPARLSLVTLGVSDIARARKFYESLGFTASGFESDSVVFFDMGGTALGLYGHDPLAEDAGVKPQGEGFRAVTLAINLASKADVDAGLAHAQKCGGTIVQSAREVFWGGYSGYFKDLDGHLWEVAYNPLCPLNENGLLTFPAPEKS